MASALPPPIWSVEQLQVERAQAIQNFRQHRMEEPLEMYLEAFDERRGAFEDLLETTVDLTQLADHALDILTDPRLLDALRYISGPPVSLDDLKTLADTSSLSRQRLNANPELAGRLVQTVMMGVDTRRFPWLEDAREPTEQEKHSAILASAALIATQRTATARRSESKAEQERQVEEALLNANFTKVPTRPIPASLADAPQPGEFCREASLGSRKADLIVGLWDRRVLAIECKVSNSATNSIKRLKNDAAAKAEQWRREFGELQVVPSAVLSGVYALPHLVEAQRRGLTLFWAHNLTQMIEWIDRTMP